MATRQQGCLGGLERSLVVLVVTLGELNLAIGPRRVGLTRIEIRRSLALLDMATRQQRGLGPLGFNRLGYVDKRKDELLAKNIMVPRYAEQQQIGAFFKQLDNLITLHQCE